MHDLACLRRCPNDLKFSNELITCCTVRGATFTNSRSVQEYRYKSGKKQSILAIIPDQSNMYQIMGTDKVLGTQLFLRQNRPEIYDFLHLPISRSSPLCAHSFSSTPTPQSLNFFPRAVLSNALCPTCSTRAPRPNPSVHNSRQSSKAPVPIRFTLRGNLTRTSPQPANARSQISAS